MSTATAGVFARDLTDLLGIGVTLNVDGSIVTITGPTWRRSTVDPNGVVTANAGSLVSQTNGTLWIGLGGNAWAAAGGAGGASYGDNVVVSWGSVANQRGGIVYNPNSFNIGTAAVSQATALASAAATFSTGAVTITGAVVGLGSGPLTIATGATDCTNAGGTGGPSGALNFSTGNCTSTAGVSGSSQNINFSTGNSDDANSGNINFITGTAAGVRGSVNFAATTLNLAVGNVNTGNLGLAWDTADNVATSLVFRAATVPMLTFNTTGAPNRQIEVAARLLVLDNVAGGTLRVVGGRAFSTTADSGVIVGNGAAQSFNQAYVVPANTLNAGSTMWIRGCVRRTGINAADLATVLVRFGASTYLTSVAVAAGAADRCFFELYLTARAIAGVGVTVVGAGTIGWTTALPVVAFAIAAPGGASIALNTNAALTVDVQINMPNNAGNTAVLEQLFVDVV